MKKRNLIPFNKNALKAVAIATAMGTVGGHIISNQIKQTKQKVDDDKKELIQDQTNQNKGRNMAITGNAFNQMKNNDILKKYPRLAIIYHTDGKIALMVDREYLLLEDAMKKYPDVTEILREYIDPACINPKRMTIRIIVDDTHTAKPENNLER